MRSNQKAWKAGSASPERDAVASGADLVVGLLLSDVVR
jgi:hypothetical protein